MENVLPAFAAIFQPYNLLLMTFGVVAGIIVGAIPGFTIAMAVILTLPFTFYMTEIQGLSTMLGVMVGGYSGGLISATLLGIPGTPAAIATLFDAHSMAKRGRPGKALGLGVWGSFYGGLISAVVLVLVAPVLAAFALKFGPWEFFSLIVFGLTIIGSLGGESPLKGLIAGALGLSLRTVGTDPVTGFLRFTFGFNELAGGFSFLPVLIGVFAFSQLMEGIEGGGSARKGLIQVDTTGIRFSPVQDTLDVLRRWLNLLRSSFIGILVGIIPAAGASISNVVAYDWAKKLSKRSHEFGKGTPDGIIASEAANNATGGGALITMMALGLPGDIITAVMLGALLIHGIQPGPLILQDYPVLSYGVFVAFFLAHFIMVLVQMVGLRAFLRVIFVPKYILVGTILVFCAVGTYSLNNRIFDIWVLFGFGLLGYLMKKFGFPLAPVILGVVLGPEAEANLGRALQTDSDWTLFFTRPISLTFLVLGLISLFLPLYQQRRFAATRAQGETPPVLEKA